MNSVVAQGILWVMALMFVASAVSKTTPKGRRDFPQSISDLVSPRAVGLAPIVIAAELATAAALVIPATAPYGLGMATVLLLAFTAVLVSAALRGVEAPCNCFGSLSRESPVGHREVVRNTVLLAVILGYLVLQGDQIMSSTTAQWLGIAITFLIAAGALAAVVALATNLRKLGIPVGDKAAEHMGPHGDGDEPLYPLGSELQIPGAGTQPTILGVLSTTCGVCVVAAGSFDQTASRSGSTFVALVDDTNPGKPDLINELDRLGAQRVLLSEHPELTPLTEIRPGYAVIDVDGRVTLSGTGHTELAMLLPAHG